MKLRYINICISIFICKCIILLINKFIRTKKIKNEIRPAVKENKTWKNQTFKLKMKITTRVGQITNTRESVNEIVGVINIICYKNVILKIY